MDVLKINDDDDDDDIHIGQLRSEGPTGPTTVGGPAGLKGPARAHQEEVVAVTPWSGAQTSCWRGGPKIVATPLI